MHREQTVSKIATQQAGVAFDHGEGQWVCRAARAFRGTPHPCASPDSCHLASMQHPRRTKVSSWLIVLAVLGTTPLLGGCGYNEVITQDENVKAGWAEVQNQYQRRADLVPNLVNTVKGSAAFEKETLESVVQARAKVGQLNVDSSIVDDPQRLQAFQDAQGQLSSALSRLMVVVEKYPDIKSTAAFQDLQAQLEGTENRIAVARKRYIEAVAEYNKVVLHFPTSLGAGMRGKKERPTFEATSPNADRAPEVSF